MTATIKAFRFSSIWTATCLDGTAVATSPFNKRADYEALFNAAQKQKAGVNGLQVPWPIEKAFVHRFWSTYLHIGDPAQLDGGRAWSKAVPLRAAQPLLKIDGKDLSGRFGAEHFYYPFGVAFVLTFYGSGSFDEPQWANAVIAAKGKLPVTMNGQPAKQEALVGIAAETLKRMRETYFGPGDIPPSDPFTIATVIRGDGVDENVAIAKGGALHRSLFGAASQQATYPTAKLDDVSLDDCLLPIRKSSAEGDAVFAVTRGRAIWIPSAFTHPGKAGPDGEAVTSMSCYHRNQLFAALQVESLCGLAAALNDKLTQSATLSPRLDDFGRIATQALVDFQTGDKSKTYRSISVARQIDDRGVGATVTKLRQRYGI